MKSAALVPAERFAELKTATAAALRSGTTFQLLSSLQQQRA